MTPENLLWLSGIVTGSGTFVWALSKSFRIEKLSFFDNEIILEKPIRWPGYAPLSPAGRIVLILGLVLGLIGGSGKIFSPGGLEDMRAKTGERPTKHTDSAPAPPGDNLDRQPAPVGKSDPTWADRVGDSTSAPSVAQIPPQRTEGPQFFNPKIDGRTIDGCIKSFLFPEFQGLQCVHDAQRVIANEFCTAKGYSIGVEWQAEDTGSFQRSYKLFVEREKGGTLHSRWIEDDTGGFVFLFIRCA